MRKQLTFLLCFFWPDCRARPRYLLLDESTSALVAANEALLYGQLAALGITPISVSHHHAIASFYDQTLELHGDGGVGDGLICVRNWVPALLP